MPKSSKQYECSNCGAIAASWSGRCHVCGEWNTLEEQVVLGSSTHKTIANPFKPISLDERQKLPSTKRFSSGLPEVDSVLGGGFVPGSVTLIAGQPGIGKSTILLQIAALVESAKPVLYVSGEESVEQIAGRAKRLSAASQNLGLVSSTSTDDITAGIASAKYGVVVVDSIQTVSTDQISSATGSVAQITNSTRLLAQAAKQTNTVLIIVGHVTKEGAIAGPKVLEHLVDVVLQLEGDRYGGFKVLRGIKNRYGSTNEVGIFEMAEQGLLPIKNPSAALLAERRISDGSVVLATMEGSRPLLVEVQALVNKTSYGYPKRAASGVDLNRLNLLIAMLERRTKLNLSDQDIYINIVGGIRLQEPAADLAICMAIASASKGMQLKSDLVVFGEVGLSGEVRHVPYIEKRLAEAKKLGFKGALGPTERGKKSASLYGVSDVRSALNQFLEKDS